MNDLEGTEKQRPVCPICGSTNYGKRARGFFILLAIIGILTIMFIPPFGLFCIFVGLGFAESNVYYCADCGYSYNVKE